MSCGAKYHVATYDSDITACGLDKTHRDVHWDPPNIWLGRETSGLMSGKCLKCPKCMESPDSILMTLGDLP